VPTSVYRGDYDWPHYCPQIGESSPWQVDVSSSLASPVPVLSLPVEHLAVPVPLAHPYLSVLLSVNITSLFCIVSKMKKKEQNVHIIKHHTKHINEKK